MAKKNLNKELSKIAKESISSFETFKERMDDSLDFIDVSVRELKKQSKESIRVGFN